MRERLIKLINDSLDDCGSVDCYECSYEVGYSCKAKMIADYLLDNGVIVPPCKPGDTVYEIRNNTDACEKCEYFQEQFYDIEERCKKIDDDDRYFPLIAKKPLCEKQYYQIVKRNATEDMILYNLKLFGDIWFTTEEEAEAKLKELKGE